jgi:DNA-directed RNA polymerase specialized sigma24 family protein
MRFDVADNEAFEALHGVERSADVRDALSKLDVVEVAVLALKFGFLYSNRDIAHVLHMPTARVAQIKTAALTKLHDLLE